MDLSVANLVRQAFKDLHTQHHNHLAIPQQASVEPHMALNSLALEPQLAWQATLEVLPAFAQTRFTPPENWPAWIECLPPTGWLLHALGEFPLPVAPSRPTGKCRCSPQSGKRTCLDRLHHQRARRPPVAARQLFGRRKTLAILPTLARYPLQPCPCPPHSRR